MLQPWRKLNNGKIDRLLKTTTKTLVIYPYCLSTNLLKEVLSKISLKFVVTNDFQQASLIIGPHQYLSQNHRLKKLVIQKKIPVYSLNQINIYQLTDLIKSIFLM
jgi:hypothetical protein